MALGSILTETGSTRSLGIGSRSSGTLITRKRAELIRQVLCMGDRRWLQLVRDWRHRGLAHRCSVNALVLFRKPFPEFCPWVGCGADVESPGEGPTPTSRARPRGRPFRNGATASAETALQLPPDGATASAGAAQMMPFLGRQSAHHKQGLLPRDEEGLQEEVSSTSSSEGFTETWRDAEIEEGLA